MKHTTQTPIFRNCPYADCFDTQLKSDCRRCDKYERCVANKAKKVKERKKAQARKRIFKTVLLLFLVLVTSFLLHFMKADSQCIYDEEPVIPYTEPEATKIPDATYVSSDVNVQPIKEEMKEENQEIMIQSNVEAEAEVEPESEEIIPYISAYQPGEVYYYNISASDKKYIEKLIYKEARGESYKGKVAVAAVVLNRFFSEDPRFDRESIYSVITQSGAFADISDVTQDMLDTVPDLKDAVEDACRGWDPTREMFENGALFFYAPNEVEGYQKEIREGIQVLQIGNHNFHNDFND